MVRENRVIDTIKKYFFIPLIVGGVIFGALIFRSNKVPSYSNNLITTSSPELKGHVDINLDNLAEMVESKDNKFLLYIGNESCGDCKDLRINVIGIDEEDADYSNRVDKTILETFPDLSLYWLDYSDYSVPRDKVKWNETVGEKAWAQGAWVKNPQKGIISGFQFNYTPTLVVVVGNKAVDVWDGFGGGPTYKSRYNRWDENKEKVQEGRVRAYQDMRYFINKWK